MEGGLPGISGGAGLGEAGRQRSREQQRSRELQMCARVTNVREYASLCAYTVYVCVRACVCALYVCMHVRVHARVCMRAVQVHP